MSYVPNKKKLMVISSNIWIHYLTDLLKNLAMNAGNWKCILFYFLTGEEKNKNGSKLRINFYLKQAKIQIYDRHFEINDFIHSHFPVNEDTFIQIACLYFGLGLTDYS